MGSHDPSEFCNELFRCSVAGTDPSDVSAAPPQLLCRPPLVAGTHFPKVDTIPSKASPWNGRASASTSLCRTVRPSALARRLRGSSETGPSPVDVTVSHRRAAARVALSLPAATSRSVLRARKSRVSQGFSPTICGVVSTTAQLPDAHRSLCLAIRVGQHGMVTVSAMASPGHGNDTAGMVRSREEHGFGCRELCWARPVCPRLPHVPLAVIP